MGRFLINDDFGFEFPELDGDGNRIPTLVGGFGKWGYTSTPHKGWSYDEETPFLEAAEGAAICQMCEKARILKVHMLRHPDYPGPLFVGCHCAGIMIGDPARARDMEKAAKLSDEWALGRNGKMKMRTWGFFMMVKAVGRGFKGMIRHVPSGYNRQSRQIYKTIDGAVLRTVFAMLRARRLKPWKEKLS